MATVAGILRPASPLRPPQKPASGKFRTPDHAKLQGMRTIEEGLHSSMRKGFIVAVLLAFVAMPMAFAGTGFCRAMPCCTPHSAGNPASIQHADCCNTPNCDQPPAAAGAYTTARQTHLPAAVVAIAVIPHLPPSVTLGEPLVRRDSSPALPPPLQRRIALLSLLLI